VLVKAQIVDYEYGWQSGQLDPFCPAPHFGPQNASGAGPPHISKLGLLSWLVGS